MTLTSIQKVFSQAELDILGKTADALTSWLGESVICEINQLEDACECALIGLAVDIKTKPAKDAILVPLGGPQARIVGNGGGLDDINQTPYECILKWNIAIQPDNERPDNEPQQRVFWLTDGSGELQKNISDNLVDLLPFSMNEETTEFSFEDNDEDEFHNEDDDRTQD